MDDVKAFADELISQENEVVISMLPTDVEETVEEAVEETVEETVEE